MPSLPIIDVASLTHPRSAAAARATVARDLAAAARSHGFFYAVNHGVDPALIDRLASHARAFFAQRSPRRCRSACRPSAVCGAAATFRSV
jgi:isopenicillin N synthase-like dioxygenase